jgi:hypothetical protein
MIFSFYKCTFLIGGEVIKEERDGGENISNANFLSCFENRKHTLFCGRREYARRRNSPLPLLLSPIRPIGQIYDPKKKV